MIIETVTYEAQEPKTIVYKRGSVAQKLDGFNAWMYRSMVGMYGEAEATEKFWWIWHKKESPTC